MIEIVHNLIIITSPPIYTQDGKREHVYCRNMVCSKETANIFLLRASYEATKEPTAGRYNNIHKKIYMSCRHTDLGNSHIYCLGACQ